MLFAVLFDDHADQGHQRARHMPDHLTFLRARGDSILAAGPLVDGDVPSGGLWLVEAADVRAVRDLVETDPFWPTGLRKSVRILSWNRVFADGRTLIAL